MFFVCLARFERCRIIVPSWTTKGVIDVSGPISPCVDRKEMRVESSSESISCCHASPICSVSPSDGFFQICTYRKEKLMFIVEL